MPDPDDMLHDLRHDIRAWEKAPDWGPTEREAAERVTSAASALDDWLSHGGILPAAWRTAGRPPSPEYKPMPLTDDLILNMAADVLDIMDRPGMAIAARQMRKQAEGKIHGNKYAEPVGRWEPDYPGTIPLGSGNSGPGGPPHPEPEPRQVVTGEDVLTSLASAAESLIKPAAEIMAIAARRLAEMQVVLADEVVVKRDDLETLLIHEQDERDGAPHPGNWEQVLRESTGRLNKAMGDGHGV